MSVKSSVTLWVPIVGAFAVLVAFELLTDYRSHAGTTELEEVDTESKERDVELAAESLARDAELSDESKARHKLVSERLDAHVKIAEKEFREQAKFRGEVSATMKILLKRLP